MQKLPHIIIMEKVESLPGVFSAKSNDDLLNQYKTCASTYDEEYVTGGYRLPALASAFLARYVPTDGRPILDAACGTGLTGDNLHILGYPNLFGIDLSPIMLEYAKKLGIYKQLEEMVLGKPLRFNTDTFSATIATGVFTEGHAPHSSFDELIRVTATGGHIIFNVRDDIYEQHGFREKQEALEAEGSWRLLECSDRFRPFTVAEPNVIARLFVYQII